MSYTKEVQKHLRKALAPSLINELYIDHPEHKLTTIESVHIHVDVPSLAKQIETMLRNMPNNMWAYHDEHKGVVVAAFDTDETILEVA